METIYALAGFYFLAAATTWFIERKDRSTLPPPDRSVKRDIEIFDEMDKLKRDFERKT